MKASKLPACVGLPRRPPEPVRLTPGGSAPATSAKWYGSVPPMNSKLKCTVSPTWSNGTTSVMFVRVLQSAKADADATQRRTRDRTTGTFFMSLSPFDTCGTVIILRQAGSKYHHTVVYATGVTATRLHFPVMT